MDEFLYISMTGAKSNMAALAARANNLANASTDGFKAEFINARSMQAFGSGHPSRVFAVSESPSADFNPGPIQSTGRPLDIAIEGKGFFVVQDANGNEALSRNGALKFEQDGRLVNNRGLSMLDDGGTPIYLPLPIQNVEVSKDGLITVRPQGAPAEVIEVVARLKTVQPDHAQIFKKENGLFYPKNGANLDNSFAVNIHSGALEGSNVNPVAEMVNLIDLQRQFEMQVQMMKKAEENDSSANKLLRG